MFGMMRSPAETYAKVGIDVAVETADPHRLIVMLFDGTITALTLARARVAEGEIAAKGENISKAISLILEGLKASLDMQSGGELAERLSALYDYMAERLLFANLRNDDAALAEVIGLLRELRDAWTQIQDSPVENAA